MKNIKKKILIPLLAGISLIITACSESGDPVPQIQHESILQSIENTMENNPSSFNIVSEWTYKDDNSTDKDDHSFIYNPSSKSFHIKDNTSEDKITEVYHKYDTYYLKKEGKWYKEDVENKKRPHLKYNGTLFPVELTTIRTMLKYKDDIKIEENSKNYIIEFTPKNEDLLKKHYKYYDSESDEHYDYLTVDTFKAKMIIDKETNLIISSEIERKSSRESLTEPGKIISANNTLKNTRKSLKNNETIDLPAEANNAIEE